MNYNYTVCNALGLNLSDMEENQISCSLQNEDGLSSTVHISVNAAEEIATISGLLDARILEQITQNGLITLLHACANPLIGAFGVGIIPGTDHFVVYKIIPLGLLTEPYLKLMLSELTEQINYWNKLELS